MGLPDTTQIHAVYTHTHTFAAVPLFLAGFIAFHATGFCSNRGKLKLLLQTKESIESNWRLSLHSDRENLFDYLNDTSLSLF